MGLLLIGASRCWEELLECCLEPIGAKASECLINTCMHSLILFPFKSSELISNQL